MAGKFISEFAESMGWKTEGEAAYGVWQGYALTVSRGYGEWRGNYFNVTKSYAGIVTTTVWLHDKSMITIPTLTEFYKANKKEHRIAQMPRIVGPGISIVQNNPWGTIKADEVKTMIQALTAWLMRVGAKAGCAGCGKVDINAFYTVNGIPMYLCSECSTAVSAAKEQQLQAEAKGNNGRGLIGAILGGIVGMIPIILVGYAGYVAAICGILMAFCIYYGFKFFKGRLGSRAFVITSVIIIAAVMTFIAAIGTETVLALRDYPDLTLGEVLPVAFALPFIPELSNESGIWGNIGQAYLFTGIGVVLWLINYIRQRKKEQARVIKSGT